MRLKKLILHGFKSFADRTEFVFDSPITGIVGPNGCGKSNVVDGFKWVLGEQSAKSLRGDAMMDVIFNGSSARKPAGLSEVILVFENPKHDFPQRIGYQRKGNALLAWIEGTQNGKVRRVEFPYLRTSCGPA